MPLTKSGRKKRRISKFRKPPPVLVPSNEVVIDDNEDNENDVINIEINGKILKLSFDEDLVVRDKKDLMKEEEGSVLNNLKNSAESSRSVQHTGQPLLKSLPTPKFRKIPNYNIPSAPPLPISYIRFIDMSPEDLDNQVEYDMDEDDMIWLEIMNEERTKCDLPSISMDMFELLMDRLEKESYFHVKMNKEADSSLAVIDDEAVCSICLDGECQNSNVILFCDMCNLAVHQDCYGVPYIPEGHWLCRRCLHSPSTPVECVLCPNNGGAFKQTDRGHWAHVVCALWIPEVRFANTVFLEPIDSIECITTARWRLICYICKQRGVGACIQCEKPNCYSAFHVTCAQQAGLYMKMETTSSASGTVDVKKFAYCDAHTPEDAENKPCLNGAGNSFKSSPLDKVKSARKALAKKRSLVPVISIPTIPPDRIQEIGSLINIPKKSYFIQRLLGYWTLKRQFRHGVPLLRRLQSAHSARRDECRSFANVDHLQDKELTTAQQNYWQHIRQDLERCRLMCELSQKRERKKKDLVSTLEQIVNVELCPLSVLIIQMIKILRSRDTGKIFLEPVDITEVPDYRDFITHPMDLRTMEAKMKCGAYDALDEFEDDFNLMIDNCLLYNSKDTKFYRAGLRMREFGILLFNDARRYIAKYPLDEHIIMCLTGEILLSDDDECDADLQLLGSDLSWTEEVKPKEIDAELNSILGDNNIADHNNVMIKLLQLQEKCKFIKQKQARAKRLRSIRSQMVNIKRRLLRRGLNYGTLHAGYASARVSNFTPAYTPAYSAAYTAPYTPSYSYDFETLKKSPKVYAPILDDMDLNAKRTSKINVPCSSSSMFDDVDESTTIEKDGNAKARNKSSSRVALSTETVKKLEMSSTSASSSPKPSTSSSSPPFRRKRGQRSALSRPIVPNSDSFKIYRLNKDVAEGDETDDESARSNDDESSSSSSYSSDDSSDSDQSSESEMNWSELPPPAKDTPENESEDSGKEAEETREQEHDNDVGMDDENDRSSVDDSDNEDENDISSDNADNDDDDVSDNATDDSGASSVDIDIDVNPDLKQLQPVWAKCTGFPWYPALIINPEMPRGYVHNGVPIPVPPKHVLSLGVAYSEPVYLVLFYDAKRTWQWLPRNKLQPLGAVENLDKAKLNEARKTSGKGKGIRKAYLQALVHKTSLT